MFRKLDMKSFLLLSGLPVLKALRLSRRVFILPSIAIYTTSRCNYRCEMCWINSPDMPKMEKMELELLEKVLAECGKLWIKPKIHFSGFGEPLVYPYIRQAMQLCQQYKLKWSLTTNGYLLGKYAEDIVSNDCNGINVSIHGDADLHNQTTRVKDAFAKTLDGLWKLEEVKQRNKSYNPSVAINCVINNHNVLSLENILKTFSGLPVNSITFQHLAFLEDELKKREDFLILEKSKLNYLSAFMKATSSGGRSMKINFFPKIHPSSLERYYTDLSYARPTSCVLPWLSVRLLPNGDLTMCGYQYGNVQEESLVHVINSQEALNFRDLVRSGEFNSPGCYRCCHQRFYEQPASN